MRAIRLLRSAAKRASLLCGALLIALPTLAADKYASIAFTPDYKGWGWATRNSQSLADKAALDGCNKSAPVKNCRLHPLKAVVVANGPKGIGVGSSEVGLDDARSMALNECGKWSSDCKVTDEITKPGFVSVAFFNEHTPNDSGRYHIVYAATDSDAADKLAIEKCTKGVQAGCKLALSSAIAGRIRTSDASPARVPTAAKQPSSCRPTTPTVHCSSRCTNGDCVVTYENGCKIRVQVHPQFDPLSNQWKYPPPSC